jgi:hypothetical protein
MEWISELDLNESDKNTFLSRDDSPVKNRKWKPAKLGEKHAPPERGGPDCTEASSSSKSKKEEVLFIEPSVFVRDYCHLSIRSDCVTVPKAVIDPKTKTAWYTIRLKCTEREQRHDGLGNSSSSSSSGLSSPKNPGSPGPSPRLPIPSISTVERIERAVNSVGEELCGKVSSVFTIVKRYSDFVELDRFLSPLKCLAGCRIPLPPKGGASQVITAPLVFLWHGHNMAVAQATFTLYFTILLLLLLLLCSSPLLPLSVSSLISL